MASAFSSVTLHAVSSTVTLAVQSSTPRAAPGPGPHLVLLHFWGGSSQTYSLVTPHLAATFPIHAIDFPGWGLSTGPPDAGAYSIASLAAYVETFLSTILPNTPIVLVGHSMGAKVAQLVASRRSPAIQLRGLVLIAPAPLSPFVLPDEMKEQQIHAYDSAESSRAVLGAVLSNGRLSEGVCDLAVQDMVRGTDVAKIAWPTVAMAEDYSEEAKKIKVRTRVLTGEKDKVETRQRVQTEVVDRIEGAELVVVENSGHLVPLEAPEVVAREILKFMEV